ncbi:hypothetical protein DFJ73DRAFT_887139 [Zopfochytrium polystomum]|nr:hypothetical protein DFJ73DRAFT_887139 [Zopfochytrium polystomum]
MAIPHTPSPSPLNHRCVCGKATIEMALYCSAVCRDRDLAGLCDAQESSRSLRRASSPLMGGSSAWSSPALTAVSSSSSSSSTGGSPKSLLSPPWPYSPATAATAATSLRNNSLPVFALPPAVECPASGLACGTGKPILLKAQTSFSSASKKLPATSYSLSVSFSTVVSAPPASSSSSSSQPSHPVPVPSLAASGKQQQPHAGLSPTSASTYSVSRALDASFASVAFVSRRPSRKTA